jgi:hypothetical protein
LISPAEPTVSDVLDMPLWMPSERTARPATPNARARKNYAGTIPITRQSGKKKTVSSTPSAYGPFDF